MSRQLRVEYRVAVIDEVFAGTSKRVSRKVAILADIGEYFGLSGSGVTHAMKRLTDQMIKAKIGMVREGGFRCET
jgi:acid stress-induced BolA-like protein IbaG/YrbA